MEIDGHIGLSFCCFRFQARLLWLWLMRRKVPCSWVRMFAYVHNLLDTWCLLKHYWNTYIHMPCMYIECHVQWKFSTLWVRSSPFVARFGESSLHHFGCRTAKTRCDRCASFQSFHPFRQSSTKQLVVKWGLEALLQRCDILFCSARLAGQWGRKKRTKKYKKHIYPSVLIYIYIHTSYIYMISISS